MQSYENFTGGVLMSLVEHGFFAPEEANDFLTPENLIAPGGTLPLNTSGGNLAECYMHGLELQIEAVRQLRGESTSQVPGRAGRPRDLGPDGDAGLEHAGRHRGHPVSAGVLSAGRPAAPGAGDGRARPAVLGGHAREASCWCSAAAAAARSSGGRSGSATAASRFDLGVGGGARPRGRIY